MTTKSIVAVAFYFLIAINVQAANKSEKIKVNGQCDMCKNRIENAVKSLDGVSKALWTKSDKSLAITYDDKSTTTQKIQTSIAMTGHDTEMFSASESGYNELPACCQYKRDGNRKKNVHNTAQDSSKQADKSGSCCDSK